MKKLFIILAIFLIMPLAFAADLEITQNSDKNNIIVGVDNPIILDLSIKNNGKTDSFSIYTLFGAGFNMTENFIIEKGKTERLSLEFLPSSNLKVRGHLAVPYFVQASDYSEVEEKFVLNIVDLEDSFEIGASSLDPDTKILDVFIHNTLNHSFDDVDLYFSSAFFDFNKKVSFSPYERENFEIELDKEEYDKLSAGFYKIRANVEYQGVKSEIEEQIYFEEKDILKSESKSYGLIVSTKVIRKTNEGNVLTDSETIVKKNIISRLFTSFDPLPTSVNREGSSVYYTWDKSMKPGEVYEITVKTNLVYPFLAIILLILIIYFAKKTGSRDLSIRKKVHFVNAKGGEFALKVILNVQANKYLEKVRIVDRLPMLAQVYNRFGGDLPNRYHKGKKIFEWEFDEMEQGERRVLSYIIYSKVGVLGKFALPRARARFKREGKEKEVNSNNAFFLSSSKEEEEY